MKRQIFPKYTESTKGGDQVTLEMSAEIISNSIISFISAQFTQMAVLRLAVNPIRTLRFAFVEKNLFDANSCERQSIVCRGKERWKKGDLNTNKK